MLVTLRDDFLYSLRGLLQRPVFAVVVVTTLACAVGVNVAVFSLYDRLLLRALPVGEPGRLVNFIADGLKPGRMSCNNQGKCSETFSYPMFRDLERTDGPFEGIAASRFTPANLGFGGHTIPSQVALVSGQYFSLLRVTPALGRMLDSQDDSIDGEAGVVVLSHDYWRDVLGADPGVLGQTLSVNGKPLEIVGVAANGFRGTVVGEYPQVFAPLTFRWHSLPQQLPNFDSRTFYWTYLFGRLKRGVSVEQAEAAINVPYRAILNDIEVPLQRVLDAAGMESFRAKAIELVPGPRGQSSLPSTARTPLTILLGATVIVLLIACVNLANLMLARGAARIGEMAVRASLGAAPLRLARLLVVEASLLAAMAAGASLLIAFATLQAIGRLLPSIPQSRYELALDLHAVLMALAIAVAATVLFALVPLLRLARTEPGLLLHATGGRALGAKGAARLRFSLATLQIGLSMLLLVLAGLFTQSLANVASVDLGLRTQSLVTFGVAPELNGYTQERSRQLYDAIEQDLGAQPGVIAVASSMVPLLSDTAWGGVVRVEGYEPAPGGPERADVNQVGAAFIRALDISLLAGRDFTDEDSQDRPRVAIVNQRFVEHYGLGAEPIGKRLSTDETGPLDVEIVGVMRDVAYDNVKRPARPQLITPRRQSVFSRGSTTFYVRSMRPADDLFAMIRETVARFDPNLPATDLGTLDEQIRENVVVDRMLMTLAGTLALIATLLAALGLYGVLSYTVAQRSREIGLRLALGARPEGVRRMVLGQVGWMALIGVPLGLVAAIGIGRLAGALLFGVAPTDPGVILMALVLLVAVVSVASYLPARRASRVDPMTALRTE